jgi:hypothetical protein
MQSLQSIWQQIETLLSQNISLIPVRDKEEKIPDGSIRYAKTPYGKSWKAYQSRIIDKNELWHSMEQYHTTAVAMVGGKVSGNLEIIDIDVKYNVGIDAILFSDIAKFYPELFQKLRIHRTPSGGYHILYRIWDGEVPGNLKLAGRMATDTELSIKPKSKTYNFLETRGEGGYALLPPSMGYTVHQDKPIPVISWQERCALIGLCQSYNTVVQVVKAPSTTKQESSYYSENPFEHFNSSIEAESILEQFGWKFFNENGNYKYYTRPDRPESGISASFNKSQRLYYIWTTSTELNSQKWYNPATLLALLQFKDDKKKLFTHLVSSGYGKIKENVEQKIIKKAAIAGKPLPTNISPDAATAYTQERAAVLELYPHGVFWVDGEDGGYNISRERLYNVSQALGYRIHNQQPVQQIGYAIHKVDARQYFDTLKAYIKEEDADIYEAIANAYEAFIQKSGNFTIERLPILNTEHMLQSTKLVSYKFYKNCYLKIDGNGVNVLDYEKLNGSTIWADTIQQREYNPSPEFDYTNHLYYKFLDLSVGVSLYLYEVIGYYAHEYKDEEGGYFAVLSEQCPDPKSGGGSGKNIFSTLLKYTTTVKNIPGTQVQFNEKFLQSWDGQRVLSISDVPKKFDFSFLKELSTGSGILKKLYSNEQSLESDQMPKLLLSTNYSYEVIDGGLKRRIIPVEFTDFFTKVGGVNAYFDAMFPADWTAEDWQGYDHIIAMSIQAFLAAKGRLKPTQLTATGWTKQFEQVYGSLTHQFINQNIEAWQVMSEVKNELFTNQYNEFCNENGINVKYKLSSQLMNRALEEFCTHHQISFDKSHTKKENNILIRCRLFKSEISEPAADDEEVPF